MERCLDAFVGILEGDQEASLDAFVTALADRRFASGFDLHVPIAAASRFRNAVIEMVGPQAFHAEPNIGLLIDDLLDAFNRRFSAAFAARIVAAKEERLRELFAWAPELFVRVSSAGQVLDANTAFESAFGLERSAWKGKRLAELDARLQPLAAVFAQAFDAHAPAEGSVRLERASGEVRQLEARAHVSSVDGETSAIGMLRDVTEQQALRAQVIHGEKLAAIGQVAASVAHELNNPLTWVISNLELALEMIDELPGPVRRELDGEFRLSIDSAQLGARRMAGIVQDLRTFSRNERDDATGFELDETLDVALKIAGPQIQSHMEIERAYGKVGPLHGFPGRVSQVIVNLVVNAGQARAGIGGRGLLRIETRLDGESVVVDVIDDGPGISPEIERRLFEPFVTSKGAEGTGLGLWTSKSLLEGLGGSLIHERRDGRTRFRLTFPRNAAPDGGERPTVRPEASSRGTVLVVDDEPAVVRVLQRRLARSGIHVLTALGPAQALQLLEARDGEVNAVLCDLSMPQMDGVQLAREMRRRWSKLERRVLFMSGAPEAVGRLSPDRTCFQKPIRFEAVLGALRQLGC